MTRPASAQDWQDVDSADDFIAYLRLLAADAERAEQGTGSWLNTTIPDFLTATDALLGFARDQAAHGNSVFAEPMMTTWWEFAVLLHNATTEPPAALPDTADKHDDAKTVDSLESLRAYLHWLIEDFRLDTAEVAERTRINKWDNSGRWAHGFLSNWIGAWAAWLEGHLRPRPALMVKHGIQREPVEPMSWRSIAIQLSGARIYE